LHANEEVDGDSSIWPISICVHSLHQKISLRKPMHTKFSQSSCKHHKWLKQWDFLQLMLKLLLILVVITLLQTLPSYFLSMPYICKGMCAIKSMSGNLKKTSQWKVLDKKWTFWRGILFKSKFHNLLEVCLNNAITWR
jgi:hypothetical protein